MIAHIFQVKDGRCAWYVISNGETTLTGLASTSRHELVALWEKQVNALPHGYVEVGGYHTKAEVTAAIAALATQRSVA